jgi:hypothetical protein
VLISLWWLVVVAVELNLGVAAVLAVIGHLHRKH